MDDRTANILDALDSTAVSLLLELLEAPKTEASLLPAIGGSAQSKGNRRLHRLKDAGLLIHQRGNHRAPGRSWALTHPGEVEKLLEALFSLARAIDSRNEKSREI